MAGAVEVADTIMTHYIPVHVLREVYQRSDPGNVHSPCLLPVIFIYTRISAHALAHTLGRSRKGEHTSDGF